MSKFDPYSLAETNISLADFLAQVDGEKPNDVAFALVCADRIADLRTLKTHPVYGEAATFESDFKDMISCGKSLDDQRIAQMLDEYPMLRPLHETCLSIWWMCNIHYPHVSYNFDIPNLLCITGDGMGLAYFEVETLNGGGKLTLRELPDHKLEVVFLRAGIAMNMPTNLMALELAMSVFRRGVNGKAGKRQMENMMSADSTKENYLDYLESCEAFAAIFRELRTFASKAHKHGVLLFDGFMTGLAMMRKSFTEANVDKEQREIIILLGVIDDINGGLSDCVADLRSKKTDKELLEVICDASLARTKKRFGILLTEEKCYEDMGGMGKEMQNQ